jgi:hypothetical protein
LSVGANQLVWKVQRQNCTLTDTLIIENTMIETPDAGANQTLCESTTLLDATPVYIGTGEWSVISGAATFVDKFKPNTRINNIGQGSNWLRWTVRTSAQGVKSDSVLIVNNQTTTANAGPDVSLCTDSFTLQAMHNSW